MEREAKLPNYKWKIIDAEKASKYRISLINVDENNVLLSIDFANIPYGMSVYDFIEMLERTGVVVVEKTNTK